MPPSSPDSRDATAADYAACRTLLRGGSRTFYAASFLLPRKVREPACALYAFCRVADDAVDEDGGGLAALVELNARLDRIYGRDPLPVGVERAFADVVARFAIPRALPEALLQGFAWDVEGRRYEDLEALQAYAARVAGTVGAMMAVLMGARSSDALARACDLGVAMQLSNIARDVGEDARAGRLYLPLSWLREAGIDPESWLANPVHSDALAGVVRRLLEAADVLYRRVGSGVAQLPLACRPGINASRILYAEIGREVERQGGNAIARRAVVSASRKARLIARSLVAGVPANLDAPAPPLAQTRFLVDAVAVSASRARASAATRASGVPWWNLHGRVLWTVDLFEQLERREQVGRFGTGD
jgi:phytoene synthase